MVTAILEVAAAYQTIQPIASLQIQIIKDIYKAIKYIRELAKEYKTRFETHTKLVEEVDSQYLRLGKLIEGLEQLSNGNTLDDANRESVDRKLKLLQSDLQKTETSLKNFIEDMTVEDRNSTTRRRKFKRFFAGLDFVSASRKELQTILDTSRSWSDSLTTELTFLMVMDNHKDNREKSTSNRDISVEDKERENFFESFKPLNLTVTKDALDTPIMRLVKRITFARQNALTLYDLNVADLRKRIVQYNDIKNDTLVLETDLDKEHGGPVTVFKGTSEIFPHCIIDQVRYLLYNKRSNSSFSSQFLTNWMRETMFLAAILSSDQSDSEEKGSRELENTVQDISILPACVGVIGTIADAQFTCYFKLNYVFQLPPSTDPNVRSLRKALTDPQSQNHAIDDRYSLALHLAQSLFLIHSAGIIHRQVRPESILLADKLEDHEGDRYPNKLGRAFLFGYGQTRIDSGFSDKTSFYSCPERSRVYRPPRHLVNPNGKRNDRYRMIDDIYGLGVSLLEIGLWTSLFKPEDGTYVENDELIKFKHEMDGTSVRDMREVRTYLENGQVHQVNSEDETSLDEHEIFSEIDKLNFRFQQLGVNPYDLQKKLIQKARDEIPRKSGNLFMKIVISCIDCFNKEIPGGFGELGVEVSPAKLLRKYEELVLNKLRKLVDLNRTEW